MFKYLVRLTIEVPEQFRERIAELSSYDLRLMATASVILCYHTEQYKKPEDVRNLAKSLTEKGFDIKEFKAPSEHRKRPRMGLIR